MTHADPGGTGPRFNPPPAPVGRLDAAWICARYESVRARLPDARFPARAEFADDLQALAGEFDVFLLDGFGVLNVGDSPVPGAGEAVAALRTARKTILVLTNGATDTMATLLGRYRRWGLSFSDDEVVASRDVLREALCRRECRGRWGVVAPMEASLDDLAPALSRLSDDPAEYADADGFILLSTRHWTEAGQSLLAGALRERPRPLLVANPDVGAPRESGFTLAPGHYGYWLAALPGVQTRFFGKPFGNAFDEAFRRLARHGCLPADRRRVAMVGDTLHTDILGGAAAGCRTVLVTGHGLFKDCDHRAFIARSGIVPDFIVPTIGRI